MVRESKVRAGRGASSAHAGALCALAPATETCRAGAEPGGQGHAPTRGGPHFTGLVRWELELEFSCNLQVSTHFWIGKE